MHEYYKQVSTNDMGNTLCNIQTIMEIMILLCKNLSVYYEMKMVMEIYALMRMIKISVMDLLYYQDLLQSSTSTILSPKSGRFSDGPTRMIRDLHLGLV